jgi:hypothetical protein
MGCKTVDHHRFFKFSIHCTETLQPNKNVVIVVLSGLKNFPLFGHRDHWSRLYSGNSGSPRRLL